MSLLAELRRRNVFRAAVAYVVLAWLILQVGDVLFGVMGLPDIALRIVVGILALGLPVALVFAWAFEITPEGIKREHEVERSRSITNQTARKLDLVVIAMLVVIALMFGVDKWLERQPAAPDAQSEVASTVSESGTQGEGRDVTTIRSIAVLPFEDFSEGENQGHLSRGIADTVLHMLAQVPDLNVAARTSSFAYAGTGTPISEIATQLGVGAVLEGSVQRSGDRLRIIAQLIRGSDQTHIWSETFNEPAGDIFAIQDRIAASVVAALRPGSASPTQVASARTDLDAYELYLAGKDKRFEGSAQAVVEARDLLQRAVEADPEFAPAWVQLALAWMDLNALTPATWAEIEPQAKDALDKALALSPEDAEVLSARGLFIVDAGYEPREALPFLERALQLNPNDSRALTALARLLSVDGDFERSLELQSRAYEVDSLNPDVAMIYGSALADVGRETEALAVAQRLRIARPDAPYADALLEDIAHAAYRFDEAIVHQLQVIAKAPESYRGYHHLAELYAELGDQEAANAVYTGMPEAAKTEDYVPLRAMLTEDGLPLVLAHAQRDLALYPGWNGGQRRYVFAAFLNGRTDQALTAAERYKDALLEEAYRYGAAAAGVMARRAGNHQLADELLDAVRVRRDQLATFEGLEEQRDFLSLALAMAQSDIETVMDYWGALVDRGVICLQVCTVHPFYDPVRDHPRFLAGLQTMRERAAAQRERLRAQGL